MIYHVNNSSSLTSVLISKMFISALSVPPFLMLLSFYIFYPFIFTFTNKAIEAEATDDTAVMDAVGRGLFGLMHARLRFDVYKNDKGEWMGKAREKHMRGRWMFPKDDVIRGEHRTMFEELDKLFEEEAK